MKASLLLPLVLFAFLTDVSAQETDTYEWYVQRLDSLQAERDKVSASLEALDQEISTLTQYFDSYQSKESQKQIQQDFDFAFEKAMSIAKKLNYAFLIDHTQLQGNLESKKSGFMARIYILDQELVNSIFLRAFLKTQDSQGVKTIVGDTVQVELDLSSIRHGGSTDFKWENLWQYQKDTRVEVFEFTTGHFAPSRRAAHESIVVF